MASCDLVTDPAHRVEHVLRALEHDRRLRPAHGAQPARASSSARPRRRAAPIRSPSCREARAAAAPWPCVDFPQPRLPGHAERLAGGDVERSRRAPPAPVRTTDYVTSGRRSRSRTSSTAGRAHRPSSRGVEDPFERPADQGERQHHADDAQARRQVVPPGVERDARRSTGRRRASCPTTARSGRRSRGTTASISARIAPGTIERGVGDDQRRRRRAGRDG